MTLWLESTHTSFNEEVWRENGKWDKKENYDSSDFETDINNVDYEIHRG